MDNEFNAWMAEVDAELELITGMGSADLPDASYRSMFDEGYAPEEAAQEVFDNLD